MGLKISKILCMQQAALQQVKSFPVCRDKVLDIFKPMFYIDKEKLGIIICSAVNFFAFPGVFGK